MFRGWLAEYIVARALVFCLHAHKVQQTLDPLDLDQWRFYVVPTRVIEAHWSHRKTMGLAALERLGAAAVRFSDLAKEIRRAADLREGRSA